jgi:hypothetical protein
MADIAISNLHATGADLFADSESYLNELTEAELSSTKGGFSPSPITIPIILASPELIKQLKKLL